MKLTLLTHNCFTILLCFQPQHLQVLRLLLLIINIYELLTL